MGKHSDAVQAFDVITRREGATSETWSRLAEALVMAEAGIVTPRAQSAINQAACTMSLIAPTKGVFFRWG